MADKQGAAAPQLKIGSETGDKLDKTQGSLFTALWKPFASLAMMAIASFILRARTRDNKGRQTQKAHSPERKQLSICVPQDNVPGPVAMWDTLPRDVVCHLLTADASKASSSNQGQASSTVKQIRTTKPTRVHSLLAALRLVCRSWRSAIDSTLKELQLQEWPASPQDILKKFPVISSLDIVGAGSNPNSPRAWVAATPPSTPSTWGDNASRSAVDVSNTSSSALLDLPSPCPSPLTRVLNELAGNSLLTHLSLCYEGSDSLAHLPALHGLTSLTLVCLPGQQQQGQPAHQALAAPSSSLPPRASSMAAACHVDFPPSISALQRLSELTISNGNPHYGPLSMLPSLHSLRLRSEPLPSTTTSAPATPNSSSRQPPAPADISTVTAASASASASTSLAPPSYARQPRMNALNGLHVMTQLHSLSASHAHTSATLPLDVCALTQLLELDISRNCFAALPSELGDLWELRALNVAYCCLRELPASLAQLSNLQDLNASGNPGLRFPPELSSLSTLRCLNLDWAMSNVGELLSGAPPGAFPAMTCLRMSGCHVSSLPPGLGLALPSLQALHLAMNEISEIPEGCLGDLGHLTQLDLSANKLAALPEDTCRLSALQRMDVRSNELRALPEDFGAGLVSLTWLDLSSNQLEQLPRSFPQLQSLRSLQLSLNIALTGLPGGLQRMAGLTRVEALYAGQAVQRELQRLQRCRPGLTLSF